MKFTIEQPVILKMLSRASKLMPAMSNRKDAPPSREIILKACGSWVFIEGPDSFAIGRETLVLQDGECTVQLNLLIEIIRTYKGVANLTFEADSDYLQFRSTRIGAHSYRANSSPPGHFTPVPLDDTWLASGDVAASQPARRP